MPNPTGWVDPLGLSGNCPGAKGCKPDGQPPGDVNGARVDAGEPELPRPLTSIERQQKIEALTEANAKRRVMEYEKKYGMHTVAKHSPEIPDDVLRQRAIDGTNPVTGITPRPPRGNPSSQFKSWKLQLDVINEAVTRKARGLPLFTGKDFKDNDIVRMEKTDSGRGYVPNKKTPRNPAYNESLNGAEVKFDPNTGKPFTAFPTKEK